LLKYLQFFIYIRNDIDWSFFKDIQKVFSFEATESSACEGLGLRSSTERWQLPQKDTLAGKQQKNDNFSTNQNL
jgi:hypothetical protein